MLLDLALISILLIVAQLVRASVPGIGRLLIPSSMVAGVLGLVAGPQMLGVLPFRQIASASGTSELQLSQYPGFLITLVFATLMMGHRAPASQKQICRKGVRSVLYFNLAAEIGQYGVAALFYLFILAYLFPGLPAEFAMMMPAGFAGGHGTATIFGQAFATGGWHDALSVGFAFATIGLAASLAGGMLFINIAMRRGWSEVATRGTGITRHDSRSFLPEQERFPLGMATANPMAIDPLLWHVALLGSVYALTIGFDHGLHLLIPGDYWVPQFAIAMLLGALLQYVLNRIGLGQFVDAAVMRRLGSLCADLLVVCGIASIKPHLLWQHAGAISVLAVLGFVYSSSFLFLGYFVFRRFWFERSLFTYGWLTGVVGFSVALLRVIDPKYKSGAVEEYGVAYLLIGPAELILYPAIIWGCGVGAYTALGVTLVSLATVLVVLAHGQVTRVAKASVFQRNGEPEPADGYRVRSN